jgi:hypothetical protein
MTGLQSLQQSQLMQQREQQLAGGRRLTPCNIGFPDASISTRAMM